MISVSQPSQPTYNRFLWVWYQLQCVPTLSRTEEDLFISLNQLTPYQKTLHMWHTKEQLFIFVPIGVTKLKNTCLY